MSWNESFIFLEFIETVKEAKEDYAEILSFEGRWADRAAINKFLENPYASEEAATKAANALVALSWSFANFECVSEFR